MDDETWMDQALALAEGGRGRTSPNPMVGAVVVAGGRLVGAGYHARAGGPHAEVVALEAAGPAARGATLYVSLEPCCHYGRTPPCTGRIIGSGVRRVVAAVEDPNPVVAGSGLRALREAGLEVAVGVRAAEAGRQNEAFFTAMRLGRPFVTLKAGASLDGKIGTRTGESRWITGPAARRRVHELRDQVDAVLVGIETVLRDDPLLTTRLDRPGARDPIRVVVDSRARLPVSARVINPGSSAPTLVAVSAEAPPDRLAELEARGVTVLPIGGDGGRVDLRGLLAALGKRGIQSALIEGGGEIAAAALRAGVVDKVMLFVAPLLIGGRGAPGILGGEGIARLAEAVRLRGLRVEPVGEDLLIEGYIHRGERGPEGGEGELVARRDQRPLDSSA